MDNAKKIEPRRNANKMALVLAPVKSSFVLSYPCRRTNHGNRHNPIVSVVVCAIKIDHSNRSGNRHGHNYVSPLLITVTTFFLLCSIPFAFALTKTTGSNQVDKNSEISKNNTNLWLLVLNCSSLLDQLRTHEHKFRHRSGGVFNVPDMGKSRLPVVESTLFPFLTSLTKEEKSGNSILESGFKDSAQLSSFSNVHARRSSSSWYNNGAVISSFNSGEESQQLTSSATTENFQSGEKEILHTLHHGRGNDRIQGKFCHKISSSLSVFVNEAFL